MLTIEVSQLVAGRRLLEAALTERRVRDNPEFSRVVELLYGAQPTDEDLGIVTRVAQWAASNPLPPGNNSQADHKSDSGAIDFLKALTRYLPDRIVISHRGEAAWFVFELPQAVVTTGSIPRVPPPHQWYVHTERVNAILKTYQRTPSPGQVRDDAHAWLRSEAYRIKLAASYP